MQTVSFDIPEPTELEKLPHPGEGNYWLTDKYKNIYGLEKCKLGVYFLFDKEEIVYVGKSTNIFKRILDHRRGRKFDSWAYYELNSKLEVSILEFYFIYKLQPKYNRRMW